MLAGFLPNLNTAFCYAFRSSTRARAGRPHNLIQVPLKQGRPSFGNFGLCHCSSIFTHTGVHFVVKPCTVSSLTSNCNLANQGNRLFVAGALSQIHCAPFVSGSAYQVFEYPRNHCNQTSMATSGTKAATGDLVVDNLISSCGNVPNFVKPTGVYFNDRSLHNCQKASISLKSLETINRRSTCSCYVFHITERSGNSNSLVGPWFKGLHTSSSPCYSDGTVPNVSFDGPACDEQLANSAVSDDQNIIGDRTLKLQSGSCYLPHPDKEKTGGEDAHFICEDEQAIGIADGVGGWADVGINAGVYARELMSNSVAAIHDELKGSIDPARVLEKAHSSTKAKGSSTACIIALTNQQSLHAINLGDSGFIVVREGCTIFRSPVQQHGFNFTYQLETGNEGDLPSSGQVFTIPVVLGDVIIAGTDGLFDNLYNNEINALVVDGVRAGFGPQVTAQKIAALARQRALDRNRQTPFSTAAQDAGFRYYGGKLDDTTVVVSYITSSSTNINM